MPLKLLRPFIFLSFGSLKTLTHSETLWAGTCSTSGISKAGSPLFIGFLMRSLLRSFPCFQSPISPFILSIELHPHRPCERTLPRIVRLHIPPQLQRRPKRLEIPVL